MLRPHFLSWVVVASLSAAPSAQAAMKPALQVAAPGIQRIGAGCNYGSHLDISGFCVDSMDYSRRCAPGFFAISFPNGNGFRCLPAEWQSSPGWFGDFFD